MPPAIPPAMPPAMPPVCWLSRRSIFMPKLNPLDHPICLEYPTRLAPSAWAAHIPFGMFLIDILRPRLLVELGTFNGVSYCAFCQAVKTLQLNTRCFAVDNWQGDEQNGFYGPNVLADLQEHHDPLYGGFSRLIQSSFDGALPHFQDGTIDLLHIDGCHTYEAARHDFEHWLPKLSGRGVVLLHDTNVRERDFGVWKLWEEVKPSYPYFEFIHEHGLGLIATGAPETEGLQQLLGASTAEAALIREFFHQLGQRLGVRLRKDHEIEALQWHVRNQDQGLRSLTAQLAQQEQRLSLQEHRLKEIRDLRVWKLYEGYGRVKNQYLRPAWRRLRRRK